MLSVFFRPALEASVQIWPEALRPCLLLWQIVVLSCSISRCIYRMDSMDSQFQSQEKKADRVLTERVPAYMMKEKKNVFLIAHGKHASGRSRIEKEVLTGGFTL